MHLTIPYTNFDDELPFGTLQICPFGIELRTNILHLKFCLK